MTFAKRSLVLASMMVMGFMPCLMAQKGAARLEGTVKDPTGALVPGASVIARNVETGVARETFTSETGTYVFPALPPGDYDISVELTGFKRAVAEKVKLDIAAVHVQNFTLEIGQLTDTVTVTAAGVAPIATTTSDIADTVQGQTIVSLPLNGRNPLELVQLNAGIAGNRAMSERGSAASQSTNYGGLGAHGARAVNNAVYLDGVDITNSEGGTGAGITTATDISQSVDAIGEFRVISANPTAEFGKNSGMQIEIVTRSGTNDLHGSLYEFHRNTILNANNFFSNALGTPRPKLIRNQFGGTIGGPVMFPWLYNGRNKTFFFFNYEGFRERQGAIVERTVLTDTARKGIFRYYNAGPNATALVDPVTGAVKSQYASNIVSLDVAELDRTRWDGIGKDQSGLIDKYISLTPMPNYYGNPGDGRDGLNFASYRFNAPDPDDRDNWVLKIDHVVSSRHSLAVRYSHGFLTRLADLEPFPGLPTRTRDEYQRGISISAISNLTSTVTNEFRFGFSRNRRAFTSQMTPGLITIDCASTFECMGTTNPWLLGEPSSTARMTYQVTNNVSWARKNHLFKGGVTVRTFPLNTQTFANRLDIDFNSEPRNQQNASVNVAQLVGTAAIPIHTNDRIPFANYFNFYLGRVGGAFGVFNAVDMETWGGFGSGRIRGFRSSEWGFFFQDDWRLNQKLTLNLGVRYELFGTPYEVNSFFTTTINRKLLDPQIDPTLVAPPVEFGIIGPKTGQRIYPVDYNNFAPTVGLSYDPFGKGKTAIRAAYRVSYDRLFSGTVNTIDNQAPGLNYTSVMNGDTLRNTGLFVKLAPGGLNAGTPMTPRLADLKGTAITGIRLNGSFDFNQYLSTIRSKGGNLPDKPLGRLTETRNSAGPYEFAKDLRTAYGQSWSFSIQHEIMRGTVIEARYIGRKGTKEYIGLPANEFRAPEAYKKEIRELQYLLTGGTLGLKPASLPPGVADKQAVTVAQLFGTTNPSTATNYSQFIPGVYNSYAFQTFPLLYPFFLAGNNSFDTAASSAIARNDYVSTLATIDNSTAQHADSFYISTPLNAVPSGKGLNPKPPERQPSADPRGAFGALPIIVGVQPNIFRPNPQFLNGPRATANAAKSAYHALQLQVQRRFYQGLQFQANYTWSKNLDITSVSEPTGQDALSFYCVYCDWSYSDNDITHNFKANFIWDIPVGRNRKWLNSMHPVLSQILGGWQIASFLEAATDFPLNVAVNGSDRTAPPTTGGMRPDWAPGYKHDRKTSQIGEVSKEGNGVFYFRPSDFSGVLARTLIGNIGNVPRNYWRGPGFFNIDTTLSKYFPIQEGKGIEFRAEFFNLLNYVNFANPSLNAPQGPYVDLSNPDAGKIIAQLGNPRLIQFAMKFRF